MPDLSTAPDRQPNAIFRHDSAAPGGQSHPVIGTAARIGQGPQNDIILDDDTVSTSHARVEFADGGWRIVDLDSKNGTYVGGTRLAPQMPTPLGDDAVVAFGMVTLSFQTLQAPGASVAEPAAATKGTGEKAEVRRAGFRLPVWLLALVVILIIALVLLFLLLGGDPEAAAAFLQLYDTLVIEDALTHLIPSAA